MSFEKTHKHLLTPSYAQHFHIIFADHTAEVRPELKLQTKYSSGFDTYADSDFLRAGLRTDDMIPQDVTKARDRRTSPLNCKPRKRNSAL